jgi:hypothetical protein
MAQISVRETPDLRSAASELGAVYRRLAEQRDLPLGRWAVPRRGDNLNSRLLAAIAPVYGGSYGPFMDRYLDAYDSVVPKLREAAINGAAVTLARQAAGLAALGQRLTAHSMAERLNLIAAEVGRRTAGFGASKADLQAAIDEQGAPAALWTARQMLDFRRSMEGATRARVAAALGAVLSATPAALDPREEARQEANYLARVLFAHPQGVAILSAYAASSAEGGELTRRLVAEAAAATAEFAADLRADPDHVWRYAPLVMLAVRQLGLGDLDGFPEYAVDLGRVLDPQLLETALTMLGLVIVCVGVVFTGPLGAVALGVADLALTGASGALAYMRELEQDMAAVSSGFSTTGRLAERSEFNQTALAGAAAFVSALALLTPAATLLRNARARTPGTAPALRVLELARTDASASVMEGRQLERALDRSGAVPSLTKRSMLTRSRATGKGTRVGSASDALSPQKMSANSRRLAGDAGGLGPGVPRELDPRALEEARGVAGRLTESPRVDPLDYNTIPDGAFAEPATPTAAAPLRTEPLDEAALGRGTSDPGAPQLVDLERANAPGRSQRGRIVTREEQIHGIELEWRTQLRGQTPSPELQDWARRSLPVGTHDPVIPTLLVDAAEADHIVAVELIRQFPGFAQLSTEAKLAVLNMPENFMAVSSRVNQARGSTPYALWTGIAGHPIPLPILTSLRVREQTVAGLLQRRIDELLRVQLAARGVGTLAPAAQAPLWIPSLTGLWRALGSGAGTAQPAGEPVEEVGRGPTRSAPRAAAPAAGPAPL